MMAQVEPLPSLPATCMERKSFCGSPILRRRVVMLPSPSFMPWICRRFIHLSWRS